MSYRPASLRSLATQFRTRFLESIPRPIAGLTISFRLFADIATRLELDTRKQLSGRMFFLAREEDSTMDLTLTLTRDTHHCHTELLYLIVSIFSIAT